MRKAVNEAPDTIVIKNLIKVKYVKKLTKKIYEKELKSLRLELVKLQEFIRAEGLKVLVLFEGRDASLVKVARLKESPNPLTLEFAELLRIRTLYGARKKSMVFSTIHWPSPSSW